MSDYLPFARPDIGELEVQAVTEALTSGWITTGPQVKQFEAEFAEQVGAKHAVALSSCTAALHLALEAIGIGPQDEVIVPAMTFAATGEVVRYLGARPVLADVREDDHNLDVQSVEQLLSPRTKAILPVHFAGQTCDMDPLLALARSHDLRVIEDAAHAFPAAHHGRTVGGLGDITCFSFYATKTITTGEGGMAVTESDEWADRMRVMSLHGISRDAWKRYTAEGNWYYEIIAPGYKYNLNEMAGALGVAQLSRATDMLADRRRIGHAYQAAFADHDALDLLDVRSDEDHSYHLFVIKLRPDALTIDRGELIEALRQQGIGTSVHFIPLHHHPYYRDTYGYAPDDLPVATRVYERSISLPIYSAMSDADVTRVIETVLTLLKTHRR